MLLVVNNVQFNVHYFLMAIVVVDSFFFPTMEHIQQRYVENTGLLLDPNHATMLKSAAASGQPSGFVICISFSIEAIPFHQRI